MTTICNTMGGLGDHCCVVYYIKGESAMPHHSTMRHKFSYEREDPGQRERGIGKCLLILIDDPSCCDLSRENVVEINLLV